MENKRFYVYLWYIECSSTVFYVGKGTKKRKDEIHNRNKYFKNVYNKYVCKNIIIEDNLTNEESLEREKYYIAFYKGVGEAMCNFTEGGTGFSTGKLNPIHKRMSDPNYVNPFSVMIFKGEDNHFYGKKHSEESKALISENRKGKGGRSGEDNPMFGKGGLVGETNPMYGRVGFKHPNSKMYQVVYKDGTEEFLTYKQCERKFGIAFTRIYEEGGVLRYKKNTKNKELYEGLELVRVK